MRFTFILQFLLLTYLIIGQNCTHDFDTGTVIYSFKDFKQNPEQKAKTKGLIEEFKYCLERAKLKSERYWYSSSIANKSFVLEDIDSTIKYSLAAFKLDTSLFCKEYINLYVSTLKEDSQFEKHYLDVIEFEGFTKMKQYCRNNYLEEKLLKLRRKKEEKERELLSEFLNKDYIKALDEISNDDQKERKKDKINWKIQNKLDSLNRIKLDDLYEIYGFPTKKVVTSEGVSNAFMVLHHSTNCNWNKKWTYRFLEHFDDNNLEYIFSFYFYRNFNPDDGICKENVEFIADIKGLKDQKILDKLINFDL